MNWSAPADTGGSPITGYVVTAYSGTTVVQTVPASAAVTRVSVTGLANGTGYTFDVVATSAAGTSPTSARSAVVVPASVPGALLTTSVMRAPFSQVLAAAPNAYTASFLAATGTTPLPLTITALVLLGAGAMLQPRVRRALFTRH